jgi:hypothetical protein
MTTPFLRHSTILQILKAFFWFIIHGGFKEGPVFKIPEVLTHHRGKTFRHHGPDKR